MGARSKGNRNEVKAVKELETNGWLVYRVKGATRFNKNVDIFGLFDIVAKKGKKIKWVQVKSNRRPPMEPFKVFKDTYCSSYESVEVWVYRDYKQKEVYLAQFC